MRGEFRAILRELPWGEIRDELWLLAIAVIGIRHHDLTLIAIAAVGLVIMRTIERECRR